ncbi:hypothetical protein [Actinoplanes rectilineatus]|uniref:hypothetical protein n=1 Tax=Actinoplanes rectilineatus TaxID=113571 RepID=UPI0005F2D67C|nr:hypothetical protein [Actinoplanes rectilineatus]
MIAVSRLLWRPWDARRLLRFLTVLAMLALVVTLRAPSAPTVAPELSAVPELSVATAGPVATDAGTEPSVATAAVAEPPAPETVPAPAAIITGPDTRPGGETPDTRGSRGPPAA